MTPGIQELMREVERVRDGFRRAVLAGEPDAAVALCAEAVTLIDLPVGTGAAGRDDLRRHLNGECIEILHERERSPRTGARSSLDQCTGTPSTSTVALVS